MPKKSPQFPHIELRMTREGTAQPIRSGRKKNPITSANLSNRQGHGGKLKSAALSIIADWEDDQKKREEEECSHLPDARRIILQIDPDAFDPDGLKTYGIEVISELENGYIIGASADLELSDLQKKIQKFIDEERGGNKVAEIWELIDGRKKPELILSPELLAHWDEVKDEQIYTVDVGVACVGTKAQLSDYPKRKPDESDEKYQTRVHQWINQRNLTYEQWDDLKANREEELNNFVVEDYNGKVLSNVDGRISKYAELPDSFSCRIQISGKGLKDLILNFPYIFDVSEPDEFAELIQRQQLVDTEESTFILQPPKLNTPKVCIIDSGIQERHPLLRAAIDSDFSTSWVPEQSEQTADYVKDGGHGTRVAGAVLYPRSVPRNGQQTAICWLQNARVLDDRCELSEKLFPPNLLGDIVETYHQQTKTRIFNHSITGSVPCRTRYMSAWASAIDELTWDNDILFIVAAGNLPLDNPVGVTRLSVREHLSKGSQYPDYLLEDSCRIANPAQSLQALTVGSIALQSYNTPDLESIAKQDQPSAFSCSGLGIWKAIKPEVVEYGGDLVKDSHNPPNLTSPEAVCPELVRSTLNGGPAIASDAIGTSYAAPKVSHIAAYLAAEFPDESCLLYRALIVQSSRWPDWTRKNDVNQLNVLRQIGYGVPNLERALNNTPNRITLITRGERSIKARQAHVYQVQLPKELLSPGEELEILLEVTLSYKAQPRRTRRNRRRYLSTWLDWDCSKRGEDPDSFLARILKDYDAPEDADKGEGLFTWTLGKQKNHKTIKDVSRSAGTIQKDWTIVKSYDLREAFCIGVVGHEGWNNDPDASVPYALVVSFEAVNTEIPIYTSIVEAQTEIKVEKQVEISSHL